MPLKLLILDGVRSGASVILAPGLTVGRMQGDFQIRDPKISSLHCRVDQIGSALVLVDLGSSNKIKVDGDKLERLTLTPGTRFVLGTTLFEVQQEDAQEPTFVTQGAGGLKEWRAQLSEELERLSRSKLKGVSKKIVLFQPFVTLEFIQGPQTGTSWYLGYGPRTAGAASPDLPLDEPSIPDEVFTLIPDGSRGATLKTQFPEIVSLNDRPIVSEKLKDGDVISINKTQIVVKYKE